MLDRITGMQICLKVASLGSISSAARALSVSPTLATKHIDAIERRIGVALFHRSTRRVSVTEAGRRYLSEVESILLHLEEADALASDHQVTVRGTLRVSVPTSFGLRVLAPILPKFLEMHPDLSVDLDYSDRVVDLQADGWDMAIRVGRLEDSSLIARKIVACRTLLCASPSYLARHGTPRTPADLRTLNCLGYALSERLGDRQWHFGAKGDIVQSIQGNLRANNGDALVLAAMAGIGITYAPDFLVDRELASGALVEIKLDQPTVEIHAVHAITLAGRRQPAKVRTLIDFLVEHLAR
ncbi:LysR family transcriptional regulator [Bradyrhizobium canariense]|uniref:DNA-binding transcriptional regulator, LysR family n=1 Tax=Bradyrhizobium canariense TaxID=255045 RepID=A0A1H2AHA4_9BRAD|nr:LysR family transcriptional regulator [Bradyrhizobium canariense]SDT45247.1 DNA-binding transcriptional regulator, LysR family [Bradyrhizobium canariense]